MTDLYLHGTVSRLSPEAPVPVVRIDRSERRQGAAANVANNIEAMGVTCERIFGGGERIEKLRVVVKGQHLARLDWDYQQTPIPCDATYTDALGRCQIAVFMDYGRGSLANIQELLAKAKEKGVTTLVDPKGHDYARYRGASLIKPNREEMKELIGAWDTAAELDFKVRQFLAVSGIESILLTQAGEGMTLYTKKDSFHRDAEAKEIVDVSGAGEAALSAYAASLAKGMGTTAAVLNASKAAAICCGRFGTSIVTEEEVFGTR